MFSEESKCVRCGKKVRATHFPKKCPVCRAPVPAPAIWLDF